MSGKQADSSRKVEDNSTKQVVGGSKRRHDEDEGTSGPVSKTARMFMIPPENSHVFWDKGAPSGLVDKQDSNNKELVTTRREGLRERTETDSGFPQGFKYRKAVNNGEIPPTVSTFTKAKKNEVMYGEGLRRLEGHVDDEDPNAESSDDEDEAADKDGTPRRVTALKKPASLFDPSKGKDKEKANAVKRNMSTWWTDTANPDNGNLDPTWGASSPTTFNFTRTQPGADTRRREISEKLNPKMYNHAHLAESSDEEDEAANADKTDKDGDAHMGEGSENPTSSKGKGKEKAEEKREQKKGAKKGEKKGSAKPCPNCKKMGHVLRHCAGPPSDDGYMHGCPVHNTMGHTYDECNTVKDTFRMTDHCHMLIMCRAGLPPIFTKIDWMEIAVRFLAQRGYPLTAEESNFTSRERFENYDYSHNAEPPQLCSESITVTWERIQENWATLTKSPIGQAAPDAVASQSDEQPEHTMDIDGESKVREPIAAATNVTAANLVAVKVEEDEEVSIIHSMSSDEDVRSGGEGQTMYFS